MARKLSLLETDLLKTVRDIELCVDGLEMKGFTPRPAEKAALTRIKAHCRSAILSAAGDTPR